MQKYIVWQTFENKLDWFSLQQGEYVPLVADTEGVVQSRVFRGLWLAVPALLAEDMAKVLAALQMGLNSSQHKAFIEILSA